MGDGKVRCTTCYNVFNTEKKEGQNVICPMCDASFTAKKINFVSNITQSITDFTTKIGSNIKETLIPGNKEDDIFKIIDGKEYDKELLEVATELTEKAEEKQKWLVLWGGNIAWAIVKNLCIYIQNQQN